MPRKKKEVIPPKAPDTPSPTPSAPQPPKSGYLEGLMGLMLKGYTSILCLNGKHSLCNGRYSENFSCICNCHTDPKNIPADELGTDTDDETRKPDDIFWWDGEKYTVQELMDLRQQGYLSYADYRRALRLPEKITIPEEHQTGQLSFDEYYQAVKSIPENKKTAEERRAMLFAENLDEDHIEDTSWLKFPVYSKVYQDGYANLMNRIKSGKISSNEARRRMGFTGYEDPKVKPAMQTIRDQETMNKLTKAYIEKVLGKPTNKRAEILQTAEKLINGDRADTYGPPEQSFGRIAELLNAMGWRIEVEAPNAIHYSKNRPLDAVDAALGLVQLKVSRIISSPDHEDSWVDAAGYAALGGEMAIRRGVSLKASEVIQEGLNKLNTERGVAQKESKQFYKGDQVQCILDGLIIPMEEMRKHSLAKHDGRINIYTNPAS